MEETVSIAYNNYEYILVNSSLINGKEVYHFMNIKLIDFLTDEKIFETIEEDRIPNFNLFCTKAENEYIPIKNKREEIQLLDEFGMLPKTIIADVSAVGFLGMTMLPGAMGLSIGLIEKSILKRFIYKTKLLNDEDRAKFIEEQNENYKGIKEKLGVDIDLDRIEKKLDKIKINIVRGKMKIGKAFYSTGDNSINIYDITIRSSDISEKKTRLHETNHYVAGNRYLYVSTYFNKLMEGANENVATDYYDNGTSSFLGYYRKKGENENSNIFEARVQYNFMEETSYPAFVSLVKQLEYITGVKSYRSAINGDINFMKAVARELGIIPTIRLCGISNKMENSRSLTFLEDFELLQDMIMRVSFDKRFEQVQSAQDAEAYLEKLRGFETYRGKITYLSRDGEIKENSTYREYYQEKFEELMERFKQNENLLEKYRYKEQEFKPLASSKDQERTDELIREHTLLSIVGKYNGDISKIPRELKLEMYRKNDAWLIYCINGEKHENLNFECGEGNDIIFDSIYLKGIENSETVQEMQKDFMKTIGAKQTTMDISYQETELEEACKKFEEERKLDEARERFREARKNGGLLPRKYTMWDKIMRRLYRVFGIMKKREIGDNKREGTKQTTVSTKSSWDLSNWNGVKTSSKEQPRIEERTGKSTPHKRGTDDIDRE